LVALGGLLVLTLFSPQFGQMAMLATTAVHSFAIANRPGPLALLHWAGRIKKCGLGVVW